jgi:hypothetical protein
MTTSEVCPKHVWNGYDFYDCGRPVKRNGLCGIHARAADVKKATQERYDRERQEWYAQREADRRAKGLAANLAVMLGNYLPVTFTSDADGVHLSVESAEKLYHVLEKRHDYRRS